MKTVSAKASFSTKARELFADRQVSRSVFQKILETDSRVTEGRPIKVRGHVIVTERGGKK